MRRNKTQAVDAKAYRHFAVITVAITLTLAIFADGEKREAIADELAAQEARLAKSRAESQKQPTLIVRKSVGRKAGGGWGADTGSAFGIPTSNVSTSESHGSGSYSSATGYRGHAVGRGTDAPPGISQAEWAQMSDEERAEYLRKMNLPKPLTEQEKLRNIESIEAASAARARGA